MAQTDQYRMSMRSIHVFTIAACLACSASVNPALKSNIDQVVLSAKTTGEASYEAPTSSDPMPLQVGQWSRYKLTDKENKPGLMTYKIVGQEGNAHWIETVHETYYQTQATLMLAELGTRRSASDIRVLRMKQKIGEEDTTEFPANMLGMMAGIWKPALKAMIIEWQDKPQQDTEVAAGSFSQAYQIDSTVSFLGMSESSRNWSHPAVPLSGLIRSEGVGSSSSMELLEFGLDGAESLVGI